MIIFHTDANKTQERGDPLACTELPRRASLSHGEMGKEGVKAPGVQWSLPRMEEQRVRCDPRILGSRPHPMGSDGLGEEEDAHKRGMKVSTEPWYLEPPQPTSPTTTLLATFK